MRTGASGAPLVAGLIVTENCNLRCPMCRIPQRYERGSGEQGTAAWQKVIVELKRAGVEGLALSGGEVTLREDLHELVSLMSEGRTPVTLNSNLMSLDDRGLERLAGCGLSHINVSIDSGRQAVNDNLRGGTGVLERVLANIKKLAGMRKKLGKAFSITVVTVLSDSNIDDLGVLFEKVSSSGADRISFLPLHDTVDQETVIVRSFKAKASLPEELSALSKRFALPLDNSPAYLKGLYACMTGGQMTPRCNAGYANLIVGPDLSLYRCVPLYNRRKPLFKNWDPQKISFKEIWRSAEFKKDRLEALSCRDCYWSCHAELSHLIRM